MFLVKLFVFLVFFSGHALCENCVTLEFLEDEFEQFRDDIGVCQGLPGVWQLGFYSNTSVPRPHKQSTSFISPSSSVSCISSFTFPMSAEGEIEVEIYIDTDSTTDHVTVLINDITDVNNAVIGNLPISITTPGIVKGWNTFTVSLMGNGSYYGSVSIPWKTFLYLISIIYLS